MSTIGKLAMPEGAPIETGWVDEMRQHIGTGGSGIMQEYWNQIINQGYALSRYLQHGASWSVSTACSILDTTRLCIATILCSVLHDDFIIAFHYMHYS
jgi:hypothetical protein